MLVLLDLSAAFDSIAHDNLFCIIEKYIGIRGNALKLMFCLTLLILCVVFLKAQF